MKIVIIGGVAGGATTAARLRRNSEDAEIILFERGKYISYANCGLPYHIGNTIRDREQLFVKTPKEFSQLFNMEVRVLSEVSAIDRDKKRLTIKNLASGEVYEESYDKLVLSPGAEPIRPPISGIDSQGIFTLRNVPDTDAIKAYIQEHQPKRAMIIGAGFIGLEMAENLHHLGIQVTIVEMADQVMNILDYEMAAEVHQHLKVKEVEFYLKNGVASIDREGERLQVSLSDGRTVSTDMIILSIGVRPESRLAKEAGLELGERGGIVVNDNMQSSDENIYALGDAIAFRNPISGKTGLVPLAGPANKQGRIVADNIIYGNKKRYRGTIGTGIAKVFDLTVASTGIPEKLAKRDGIEYRSCIIHSGNHAGYYPNAIPMSIKILYAPDDGKLLGAQVVGYEGVDKRIDLFASVIGFGGTIYDLQEIEHAYAPPFSSAKDPVNIAGFVAENVLAGRSNHIQWDELAAMNRDEIFLLDVRTRDEYELGTIDGAHNIPHSIIREHLNEIPKDKPVVLFCGVGLRGYVAERVLKLNGYTRVSNLTGGIKTYSTATMKQSNEDIFAGDVVAKDDEIHQVETEGQRARRLASQGALKTIQVDACGMQCPGPVMKLKQEIDKLERGQRLEETATDPGFAKDVYSWAKMTGNRVIEVKQAGGKVTAVVEKGQPVETAPASGTAANGTTMVVFSDDLDKALASFVIANGAAAAGKDVTLFFTFWGLNVVKRDKKPKVKKDLMGRMFSMMLASSSRSLKLSKMNMGGMGSRMMRRRMKRKGVDSLEAMMQSARDAGVRLVACQMSMDVMGVSAEELMDGVEVGGVASFLEASDGSRASLFI